MRVARSARASAFRLNLMNDRSESSSRENAASSSSVYGRSVCWVKNRYCCSTDAYDAPDSVTPSMNGGTRNRRAISSVAYLRWSSSCESAGFTDRTFAFAPFIRMAGRCERDRPRCFASHDC